METIAPDVFSIPKKKKPINNKTNEIIKMIVEGSILKYELRIIETPADPPVTI